jgi:hypothetical protein
MKLQQREEFARKGPRLGHVPAARLGLERANQIGRQETRHFEQVPHFATFPFHFINLK